MSVHLLCLTLSTRFDLCAAAQGCNSRYKGPSGLYYHIGSCHPLVTFCMKKE